MQTDKASQNYRQKIIVLVIFLLLGAEVGDKMIMTTDKSTALSEDLRAD